MKSIKATELKSNLEDVIKEYGEDVDVYIRLTRWLTYLNLECEFRDGLNCLYGTEIALLDIGPKYLVDAEMEIVKAQVEKNISNLRKTEKELETKIREKLNLLEELDKKLGKKVKKEQKCYSV